MPRDVRVQNVDPREEALLRLRVRPGLPVKLRRDYEDVVDKNAIIVELLDEKLGTLPRAVAQVLAPEMDTGLEISGSVVGIEKGRVPKITVRLTEAPEDG